MDDTEVLDGGADDGGDDGAWMWREPARVHRLPMGFFYKKNYGDPAEEGTFVEEVELAPIDGFCEDLLRTAGGSRKEKTDRLYEVLSRCTVRLGDVVRPESLRPDADGVVAPRFFAAAYQKMPLVDLPFALIRLRQLSVHDPLQRQSGHKFSFEQTCPLCKRHIPDLFQRLDALEVTPVDPAVARATEHVFEATGWRITWRTPLGEDQPRIWRAVEEAKADQASAILALHTTSINGAKVERLVDLKRLPLAARNGLRAAFEVGGIDTKIVTRCPYGGHEFAMPLPWSEPSFFFPSAPRP